MTKKYIAILSLAIFLVAGSVLADQTWTEGNFKYVKTANGVKITQLNKPAQTSFNKNNSACIQQCMSTCNGEQSQNSNNQVQTTPPVTQRALNIASVAPISDINVDYGTDIAAANLPSTVTATMSDNTTQSISVTWDGGTPAYDGNTADTYVFSGTLTLPSNTTNTNNLKASVNVTVAVQSAPSETPASDLLQTTSPSMGDILQQAASSLLNGVNNFFNFISSPFKKILHIK